ncbi:MAG TPA: mercuric reductase [Pirellulales bacterium]|nr:mercuric reductase [Pirellulales bacterium]
MLVMEIEPPDEYDRLLRQQVAPAEWANPAPKGRYNLVVIGGGTAGLISAIGAAGLGARAALVERHRLGGDCLNYGCVPSKALIAASRAIRQLSLGEQFGFRLAESPAIDFPAIMERMRRLRAEIGKHDAAERLRALGVDVFFGQAAFAGPDAIAVDGQTLRFRRAVIATGSQAAAPAVEGLAEVGYLTNQTIFSLAELPRRLIVLGGGPIGCELSQAFRRFGSEVHLVDHGDALLKKESPEAASVVRSQFEREGVCLHLGWEAKIAEKMGGSTSLLIERGGEKKKLIGDAILVAVGRKPQLDGLGLEAAGVRYSQRGVEVDDRLRTSNRAIFAAGDVCSRYQFTHAADAMARLCIQNALFLGRKKASALLIPRCTYTDPEVAHVGLTEREAGEQGIAIDSYRVDLEEVDRAILDSEEAGFAVVHTRRGGGRVVGATIVARHAGEMIGEITLLMTNRLSLTHLARTIHCYPTQAEALKRIADNYTRTRLTPLVARIFEKWLAWRR